ncbi:hypothetical protein SERLA73DRAFT_128771 [Serpula lacrymans var. lacrymans S7.3]|uniref:C2H2-type domain-containing protein n=2 Tax=Serpula lacrymans var. lacrymans TaxID=341189 RepID=F8PH26_SERL3|nr:uncharacterized protein SERLADRAFT_375949 [Serpula lacrymans var. lacrymans S7.9]EGO04922.1 hypothetical protein SERLA73DRAFT_128771 [Serpula lacrymans var. lacrymans S7.3]EGO30730.1 hypothetical protein SERLADRAFT_375949 [Serpula lacrymans var. lacrymans S7.9]
MGGPTLSSVLPSQSACQDVVTTLQQLQVGLARVTTPNETPIFICRLEDCYRLFPSKDRLMFHRKRDHGSDDGSNIVTWNA